MLVIFKSFISSIPYFSTHPTKTSDYYLPFSAANEKFLRSSKSFYYTMCHQDVAANGWTSMPANAGAIFSDRPFINKPDELLLSDIKFPSDDPVVSKTSKYAKEVLHPETFNHSMRVYFYGMFACL